MAIAAAGSAARLWVGWDRETPLWYYILKESEVQSNGDRLGEVGGRIVGEVPGVAAGLVS